MLLPALLQYAGAAPCAEVVGSAELLEQVARGEQAFVDRNPNAVYRAADEVRVGLACLARPPLPSDIGRVYVLFALRDFLQRDRDGAIGWLEAAVAVDPAATLPDPSLPANHPLRILLADLPPTTGSREELPRPAEGWLVVDGKPQNTRPLGRPWLFQWVDPSGAVLVGSLVRPDAPVPTYASRQSAHLLVLGGLWHHPNPSGVSWLGALTVGATLPAGHRVDLDGQLALNPYNGGFVPSLRAGARTWLTEDRLGPWLGLVGTVDLHADGGTLQDALGLVARPGLGLPVGVRLQAGPIQLEAELLNSLAANQRGRLSLSSRALAGFVLQL